jgi:hypothetical protein
MAGTWGYGSFDFETGVFTADITGDQFLGPGGFGPFPMRIGGTFGGGEVRLKVTGRLANGSTEAVEVTVVSGEWTLLKSRCPMLIGEAQDSPWLGAGLFTWITDIDWADDYTPPPGASGQVGVYNDVPGLMLANGGPLAVENQTRRFWDGWFVVPGATGSRLFAVQDLIRGLFAFYSDDGNLWHKRRLRPETDWLAPVQDTTGGNDACPSAVFDEHRRLHLCYWHNGDPPTVVVKTSEDYGATWGGERVIVSDASGPFIEYDRRNNISYFLYWRDGALRVKRSADFGATFIGAEQTVVTGVEEQQATIRRDTEHGHLLVVYADANGNQCVVKSTDDGASWSAAVPPPSF